MGHQKLSDADLRYWRIYAALQELCHATDADIVRDKDLAKFLDLNARATRTYQDMKREEFEQSTKSEILKQVGIPTIKPRLV